LESDVLRSHQHEWHTATVNLGVWWAVLDVLREQGCAVGPALHCGHHMGVHLPVSPWPELLPTDGLVSVRRGWGLFPGLGRGGCPGHVWLLPPVDTGPVITHALDVFNAVHRLRTRDRWSQLSARRTSVRNRFSSLAPLRLEDADV
jgi:hypothetical protein